MTSRRAGVYLRFLLTFVTVLPNVSFSQTAGGTILGAVKDPQGAAVPDASVTIHNNATGVTRSVLTNRNGSYQAANLQPGSYGLTVKAPGFSIGLRKDVTLNVGAEIVIDFDLQVGSVNETVEVTAQEATVDLASSTVSRTVEGSTIRELPLNGRDWTQLATLEPGIAPIGKGGSGGRGGNGVKLTVSGARPSENNFRLDGISLNDSSNSTPGNILGTNLGVEAVREFSVVASSYSAEYGRATGGVINAVTRSGTNDIHGTLFYFHRNSALDARDFFDGSKKPSFRRHQFGAAAGGPIVKNRTFWFADYEGVREFLASTSVSTVLSGAGRQGLLSTGTVAVDPQIARVLPLLPLPNGPLLGKGDTGQYYSETDKLSKGKYFLGKIDHRFSDASSLSGSYFYEGADSNSPDAFRVKRTADTSHRQAAILEYTRTINPTVMTVSRFGFSRSTNIQGVITTVYNPLLEDRSLGFIPGSNMGALAVPGITIPGGGPGATDVTSLAFNSFQFHQNLYITRGIHTLKTGATLERMQYNMDIPNLGGGQFSFGSLPDFLANRPSVFAAAYPGTDTRRGLRQTLIGGYLQDDARVRKNLTFNIGLRYEFVTIPTEVNGKIAFLHNLTDTKVTIGGPIHDRNPTARNFSPRIGVVWDPFKDGKTSLRSSFGIFDSLPLVWLYDTPLTRSLQYFLQGISTSPPVGSFPKQAFSLLQVQNLRTAYVDTTPGRSYSLKWNFEIQRQIGSWVAEAGYAAARGIHLPVVERNMNTVIPTETPNGWVYDPNAKVLNPNFSSINTTDTWNADSYYHALQTSIKRAMNHGLQILGSYTWSKSMDTASSTGSTAAGSGYSGSVAVVTPLIMRLNRGLSDFDVRHNFVFSMIWEIPFAGKMTGLPGKLLSHWQAGSIFRAQTGTPFTVVLNGDRAGSKSDTTGLGLGQRPNLVQSAGCKTLTNPGNPNGYIKNECFTFPAPYVLGNLGRNTLTKPSLTNLDFSLFKDFKFTERLKSQFRMELFNAFNHTNFGTPATTIFDNQGRLTSNSGLITSTAGDSRRIQFGLKLNF
jgi:hypothetical protein